jgi:hypothetical protein
VQLWGAKTVKTRTANYSDSLAGQPASAGEGPFRSWARFWFTPIDPVGLNVLRVLAGLLFLGWLLTFMGRQAEFFGPDGWFDQQAVKEGSQLPDGMPAPAGWSVVTWLGSNPALVQAFYWLSVGVVVLFTLGVAPRLTSILTWLAVISFIGSPVTSDGADYLMGILAFYLMIGNVLLGQWSRRLSLVERVLGSADAFLFRRWLPGAWTGAGEVVPSYAANVTMRLLQVHFALVVVVSGLHKLQMGDWWSGVAFWYPLHPVFETTAETLRQEIPFRTTFLFIMSLSAYAVLAWQIGFALFAWRGHWWRVVLLGGAALGWLGLVALYRLPYFGPLFCVVCLAYLTPAEWRGITSRLARLFRLSEPAATELAATEQAEPVAARS